MKATNTTILPVLVALTLSACAGVMPYLGHGVTVGQAVLKCATSTEPAKCLLDEAPEVIDTVTDTQVVECADAIEKAEQTHDPADEAKARKLVDALEE